MGPSIGMKSDGYDNKYLFQIITTSINFVERGPIENMGSVYTSHYTSQSMSISDENMDC